MHGHIYSESLKRAKHRVWIMSDLQQSDPIRAKECLDASVADFERLGRPADMVWYLGDCIEGTSLEAINSMCDMQQEAFERLGIPLCYVAGNHDLDYSRYGDGEVYVAFYETVKRHKGWYAAQSPTDPYYKVRLGEYMVYFFTDHIAPDKSWDTTHGEIHGDKEAYPHIELLQSIKHEMQRDNCPIITASHYSFAGGSRASRLFDNILPLPQQVKLHFYGHAHIGDLTWAGDSPYQRISWVEHHDIPQINVSSFEHIRGHKCRSVFLHIYQDGSCGIFFRNHDDGVFTESYFPSKTNYPYGKKE